MKKKDAQVKKLEDLWKRALADYQNLEKRIALEKEEFVKFANRNLILRILPAIDSLEKAEEYLKDEGLSLALRQLKEGLFFEGLEKIEVKGKDFNPEEMECVAVGEGEEGKVLEEIRAGYRLNGKVLRAAQVKVGKKATKKEDKIDETHRH